MVRSTRGLGIDDIIGDKRQAVLDLAAKHGAFNVRVIGSVARGDAGPESDVDLLVDWDMKRISPWGGVGLDLELTDLLGRKVNVLSVEDLHWALRERIQREVTKL